MRLTALLVLLPLVCVAPCHAAPEDFGGTFKGSETTEVRGCTISSYDGTTTGAWTVTQEVKGAAYTGKGSNATGEFTSEGKIAGDSASGTVTGVNKWNQQWQGEFTAKLEGNTLRITTKGSVGGSGCSFLSEVTASKS